MHVSGERESLLERESVGGGGGGGCVKVLELKRLVCKALIKIYYPVLKC